MATPVVSNDFVEVQPEAVPSVPPTTDEAISDHEMDMLRAASERSNDAALVAAVTSLADAGQAADTIGRGEGCELPPTGSRVLVYWPLEKKFFPGIVVSVPSPADTVVPATQSPLTLTAGTEQGGATQVKRLQQELASTRAALLLAQAETATAVRVAEALKACTPAGSSASCLQCIAASNLKAAKAQKRRAYEKKKYREKGGREAQKRKRAVKKEKLEPKEEELLSQLTQETLSQEY